jgi:uncharacterized protein (DUF302 family)
MFYVAESGKAFEEASAALESAVKHNGFGVLHVHDLGASLRGRGIPFGEECRVFEVCNPAQAAKVMSADMRLNMVLPCRVSVYTEKGSTKIGFVKPGRMLSALSSDAELAKIAAEVEEKMVRMVEEAK